MLTRCHARTASAEDTPTLREKPTGRAAPATQQVQAAAVSNRRHAGSLLQGERGAGQPSSRSVKSSRNAWGHTPAVRGPRFFDRERGEIPQCKSYAAVCATSFYRQTVRWQGREREREKEKVRRREAREAPRAATASRATPPRKSNRAGQLLTDRRSATASPHRSHPLPHPTESHPVLNGLLLL